MAETLLLLLKISVVFATAGSLLELGLQLKLRQTLVGVRHRPHRDEHASRSGLPVHTGLRGRAFSLGLF